MRRLSIFLIFALLAGTYAGCKKKIRDVNNVFVGDCEGCGSFRLTKFDDDKRLGISVSGNRDALELTDTERSFDIADLERTDLWIIIREFDNPPGRFSCIGLQDVDPNTAIQWEAISGTARFTITEDNVSQNNGVTQYKLSCSLENVTFRITGDDETLDMEELKWDNILVGD